MLFVLAKFDVRVGNQVVWTSEPTDHASLPGIEFKMIPSGLHDRTRETIYFVCGSWHGVARYEARVAGNARTAESARMFSLAALVPMREDLPWGLEPFLAMELRRFLDLGASTDPQSPSAKALPTWAPLRADPRTHPVLAAAAFLRAYGPMVFELWKSGLSRTRTLLAPIPGQSIRAMGQFTYLAAQISALPADVAGLVPVHKHPIPLLYNVAVSDLQRLQSAESFWATTTDGLLLTPSRDACDFYADERMLHDLTGGSPSRASAPTWRDRRRFALLVDALGIDATPAGSGVAEAFVDAMATSLMWWASAGESALMDRDETAPLLSSPAGLAAVEATEPSTPARSSSGLDTTSDVVALIGQFQQYTRQFVRVFAKLADDDDATIRVAVSDIAAMGLDPFAASDRDFIRRFSLTWFDRPVVFTRCCC